MRIFPRRYTGAHINPVLPEWSWDDHSFATVCPPECTWCPPAVLDGDILPGVSAPPPSPAAGGAHPRPGPYATAPGPAALSVMGADHPAAEPLAYPVEIRGATFGLYDWNASQGAFSNNGGATMTELVYGWDAAFCPDPLPEDSVGTICQVYVGGTSAYRTWTPGERSRVAHMPKLPVWVPTPGTDNPRQEALAFLRELELLGWGPSTASGDRLYVMVDLETGKEPDAGWLDVFASYIWSAGLSTLEYGSREWIYGYHPKEGRIIADPDGVASLSGLPAHTIGKQYQQNVPVPGGKVDLDVYDARILSHLWI